MPCIECEDEKWRWGETGDCIYDSHEECEKANQERDDMKKRFQHIQMSAGKAETRLAFHAEHSEDALTVYVHDVIGDSFEGLDSGSLVPIIDQNHDRELIFNINTPGGSVFDAIAVYTAAVLHGNVRSDITGMAGSAGTILASSAGNIRIATTGAYWVHQAWTIAMGNAMEMEAIAKDLRDIDADIADLLATRSGNSVDEIVELMIGGDGADGTRFNGREAVDLGFADELIPLKEKPEPENDPEQDIVKRSYLDMVVAHRKRAAA